MGSARSSPTIGRATNDLNLFLAPVGALIPALKTRRIASFQNVKSTVMLPNRRYYMFAGQFLIILLAPTPHICMILDQQHDLYYVILVLHERFVGRFSLTHFMEP